MSRQTVKDPGRIHPSAVVDPNAQLHESVTVGPQACIGADVEVGEGTTIGAHAVLQGPLRIGRDNSIHAHVCLGDAPQDSGYDGEPTRLEIGDGNTFREFVSIHRGSTKDEGVTRVGNHNLFMNYCHLAHDGQMGDNVSLANCVQIGGHVHVGNRVNIGGVTAVHQFARIGDYTMIGGGSVVLKDIPPFAMASGNKLRLYGLNRRGLQRAGFSTESIRDIKHAYHLLFRAGLPLAEALEQLRSSSPGDEVQGLIRFIEESERGVTR